MTLPIFQVDAFTSRAFAGNPAAVCLLDTVRSDSWMQGLAAEMNLSETAFVLAESDGIRLRWFTPRVEVDLCGHATLASAHVLWTETSADAQPLRFHTRSGTLLATQCGAQIELDFPAETAEPADPPAGLLAALQLTEHQVRFVGRNRMDYLIEVDSQQTLSAMAPQFSALATAPVRGTIVTSRAAGPDCDFVSRFFAPRVGVDEDPVTGSAHCCLAPYWHAQLGQDRLRARQISARGGELDVQVAGDRVKLRGTAVTVLRGTLSEAAD